MSIRKPIIAALIAMILFVCYVADRHYIQSIRLQEIELARLINFDANDATRVELDNEDGHFVLEKRDGDQWWLLEPREMLADQAQVVAMIDNFHGAKKNEEFKTDDLSKYGLDEPSPVVQVFGRRDGKDQQFTVFLGNDANRMGRVYGMIDGQGTVFTTGDWVRNQANKSLKILRDKQLLHTRAESIESIHVEARANEFSITRADDSVTGWWMNEADRPADKQFVERVVNLLASARAVDVFDEVTTSTVQLGFDRPLVNLSLQTLKGEQFLTIGNKLPGTEDFYVRSTAQPTLAIVRGRYVTDMMMPESKWGSGRFVWHRPSDFARIETQSGNTTMAVVRDSQGDWKFDEFDGIPIHPVKMQAFLDALSAIAGQNQVAESPSLSDEKSKFGLRDESYTVRITLKDGSVEGLVQGSLIPSDGTVHLKRLQDDSIWLTNAEVMHTVRKFRRDLEDRRIETGYAEKTKRIVLVVGATKVTFVEENNVWKMKMPGKPVAVLPTTDVQRFLFLAEELEWDNELASVTDQVMNMRIEFYDGDGAMLHWIDVLTNNIDSKIIRTNQGIYTPDQNELFQMDLGMATLLELGKADSEKKAGEE